MSNLPVKTEQIPEVDRILPERSIGLLPQWLTRSLKAVSGDHKDQTIPGEMALSHAERVECERHVAVLEKAAASGPVDRIGAAIVGILGAFPAQTVSEDGARVRSMMYREALADLPAWSVERAVTWWNRGERSEGKENYAFPPSPPQVRRLALIACQPLRTELAQIKRLLEAEVLPELHRGISDDSKQRVEEMAKRALIKISDQKQAAE